MKSIEQIVDELTADNLEEGKSLLKNHILLMKYGMEHHELNEEEMTEILTEATLAPSSVNMQPWRFLVIEK